MPIHIHNIGITNSAYLIAAINELEKNVNILKEKTKSFGACVENIRFANDCVDTINCMVIDTIEMIDKNKIG